MIVKNDKVAIGRMMEADSGKRLLYQRLGELKERRMALDSLISVLDAYLQADTRVTSSVGLNSSRTPRVCGRW